MDIEKWVDIAKECKYLPENDLKVCVGYLCEQKYTQSHLDYSGRLLTILEKLPHVKLAVDVGLDLVILWSKFWKTFEQVLTRSRFKELIFYRK